MKTIKNFEEALGRRVLWASRWAKVTDKKSQSKYQPYIVRRLAGAADEHPLGWLVDGLNRLLEREPYVERGECHVSEEFAWLMPAALHAVDRLEDGCNATGR